MPFTFTYFGLLTHVHETLDTYSSPQIPSCSFPAVLPKNSLALPQPLGLGSSCPHAWCSFALLIIQWSFRSHQFRNKNIKNSTKIQVIPVRPYQFPLFQKKNRKTDIEPSIPGYSRLQKINALQTNDKKKTAIPATQKRRRSPERKWRPPRWRLVPLGWSVAPQVQAPHQRILLWIYHRKRTIKYDGFLLGYIIYIII